MWRAGRSSWTFVPHLPPSTVESWPPVMQSFKQSSLKEIREAYEEQYSGETFIRLLPEGRGGY